MVSVCLVFFVFFFFSSRRRHTRCSRDWSSDVCSSDLSSSSGAEPLVALLSDSTAEAAAKTEAMTKFSPANRPLRFSIRRRKRPSFLVPFHPAKSQTPLIRLPEHCL